MDGTATRTGSVFKPAFMLMSGRAMGFAVSFAIPVVLARLFDRAEFGTYKQLFLIYTTLYGIGQLGMAESLYYFLPTAPAARGSYVVNSLLCLGAAGALCLVLLWGAAPLITAGFHNPQLGPYLPLIGIYLLCMLVAAVFEIAMITRKHHLFAFGAYALSDVVRSALYIVPALLFRSLEALMLGAVAFAVARLFTTGIYVRRVFGGTLTFDPGLLKRHLGYALPFALAVAIETLQTNLHMYVVSYHFDAATFAVYSVGCLQVPLVDFLMTSTSSVMMVKMSEDLRDGKQAAASELWLDTTRKLVLVFAPLVGGLIVVAHKLIVLLFTENYAASAPLFMVWTTSMLLSAIMTDSILRVHADTRFLIVQNLIRLAVVVLAINWCLARFGLMGGVLVTLGANLFAKAAALTRIERIMHCGLARLLPWKSLLSTCAIAAAATVPCFLLDSVLQLPAVLSLLVSGAVYAGAYGVLLWLCGPLNETERRRILEWLQQPAARLGWGRRT